MVTISQIISVFGPVGVDISEKVLYINMYSWVCDNKTLGIHETVVKGVQGLSKELHHCRILKLKLTTKYKRPLLKCCQDNIYWNIY